MKFKYMIRGLGLGIIITAAVLGAYNRNAVADARVAVLKDYGLDGESPRRRRRQSRLLCGMRRKNLRFNL